MKRKLSIIFLMAAIIFMAAPVDKTQGDITFAHSPDADFSFWPRTGYAPLIVAFTNQSRHADEIKWTLWDVVIDETQFDEKSYNIIYQYRFPGTFPVYLEATNEVGTDIAVGYVTVLPSPTPPTGVVQFMGAPRAGPAGTTVNFINLTPGTFDKYLWDFGDGKSATEEDTSNQYTSPGLYTVSLTLMNESGYATETKVNYINITPASSSLINPDFIATPVSGALPHAVQFSNLTGGAYKNILWDFGDGTSSNDLNPKHIYNTPGQYTVTLKVDGEEFSKADYINILESMQGQRPPAAVVLNDDESQLAILQDFRDKVLTKTLPGLGLSELYYKHSLEITSILLRDETLREDVGNLVKGLIPGFQLVINGGTMTITTTQMDIIKSLVGRIASQSTPELEGVLTQLVRELTNGQFLKSIGITVATN